MNSLLRTLTAIILLLTGWSVQIVAQSKVYTISGQVTDAATGEGIPFASIALKGKTAGTTSDVNGRYVLRVNALSDSLQVLSLGYRTGTYPVLNQATQVIDAHLLAAATSLQEVKVYAKGGELH